MILEKEIEQFQKQFQTVPLWVTTVNGEYEDGLLKALHTYTINPLAATSYFNSNLSLNTIPTGSFIFIEGNQYFNFQSKAHLQLVKSTHARSVEENLFNLKTKTEDMP